MGGGAGLITFEQAKKIVTERRSGLFPKEAEYQVSDYALQNSTHYQIFESYNRKVPGSAAWVRPNDESYITVNKTTGEYRQQEFPLENATTV